MATNNRMTEEKQVVRRDEATADRAFTFKATQIVWLLFGLLLALLALRVGLRLIAANPAAPFVTLIYAITGVFLWPFQNITISPTIGSVVLEIPTIIAMFVYALIGWAIERLVWVIFYRPRGEVVEEVDKTTTNDHTP